MNANRIFSLSLALVFALLPTAGHAGRGGGGRPSGGFDMHGDGGTYHPPQTATHSSTGPAGTNRTTTATNTGNGYNRTTTATNGDYNRTTTGGASNNGNYYHSSTGSNGYGTHSSSTNGNYNSGNYNHSGSGSNPYGSYNTSGSGNTYNHTYSGSGTATNAWGQTYHSSTYANNGYVYHGAVSNESRLSRSVGMERRLRVVPGAVLLGRRLLGRIRDWCHQRGGLRIDRRRQ